MRKTLLFLLAVLTALLVSYEAGLSLPMFGVSPDILLITLVAFSMGERPTTASAYGFVAGLARDMLLLSPKGLSAFAYAMTAYAVGLAGEVRSVWAVIGIVSGATFVSQVLYGFATLLLSESATVAALPRVALATTAYNTVLAPLLIPPLRRFVAMARSGGVHEGGTAT